MAMKVIVFAATKGGVGKTTLAFNVAMEAAKSLGVLLIDLDPQQSLRGLWERRGEVSNPRMIDGVDTVSNAVQRLTASGYARDALAVDTPGSHVHVIRDAIIAADIVILPVQPSPMDLLAQAAVCDLVQTTGRQQVLFALNRVDPRTSLAREAAGWLAEHYPHPVVQIKQRAAYARSAVVGKAAGDLDKEAAAEIKALWAKIQELMG